MSSTISVSRRVAAFRTPTQVLYALFESNYCSNVTPQIPREECVAFGTFSNVLGWIFIAMDACAGRMHRRPGGNFTPMGYLKTWLKAFAEPTLFADRGITLRASSDYRATLPINESASMYRKDGRSLAMTKLAEYGYGAAVQQLRAGEAVDLMLHQDGDVLAAIYGDASGRGISPYLIIDTCGIMSLPRPELNPLPDLKKLPRDRDRNTLYRIALDPAPAGIGYWPGPTELFVLMLEGGKALIESSQSMIGTYARDVGAALEQQEPGLGLAAVHALAADLRSEHPALPGTAVVSIDARKEVQHTYYREAIEAIKAAAADWTETEPNLVEMTFASLVSSGKARSAFHDFPSTTVRFVSDALQPEGDATEPTTVDLFGHAA